MAAPAPAHDPPGFPLHSPERYVTRRELAALMGVSIDTVDRLVADGMPDPKAAQQGSKTSLPVGAAVVGRPLAAKPRVRCQNSQ